MLGKLALLFLLFEPPARILVACDDICKDSLDVYDLSLYKTGAVTLVTLSLSFVSVLGFLSVRGGEFLFIFGWSMCDMGEGGFRRTLSGLIASVAFYLRRWALAIFRFWAAFLALRFFSASALAVSSGFSRSMTLGQYI